MNACSGTPPIRTILRPAGAREAKWKLGCKSSKQLKRPKNATERGAGAEACRRPLEQLPIRLAMPLPLIPARRLAPQQAGIQSLRKMLGIKGIFCEEDWVPAFAGTNGSIQPYRILL
jgi:hypothetical protein